MVKKRVSENCALNCSNCFSKILIFSIIIFVLQVVFVFLPIFHDGNFRLHNIFGNLFIVLLALLALISTFRMYLKIPSNFPRENKGNLFLLVSLVFLLLGDVLWLVSEVFFGSLTPIGSYPDLAWILAYVFLIISLIYFISISFRPSNKVLYFLLVFAILIGGIVLYQDVAEDFEEGSFDFAHGIQDSYILFDFIVLFLIAYLVWPLLGSGIRYGLHWIIIGGGVFTRLVYDRIFAEMSENGSYYTGHPVDLLYVALYVFIALAFYVKSRNVVEVGKR